MGLCTQRDFRKLLQRLIVVLHLAAVVEVLGNGLPVLFQRQLDEMNLAQPVGEFQLDALLGRVFTAVYRNFLLPGYGGIHVEHLYTGLQAGTQAGVVVHHLHLVGGRVPLDVQRLGRLFDGEVRRRRLEVVVVRLPYHRRPARMAHPHQQSHAVLAARLEEAAVAVVVHPLS